MPIPFRKHWSLLPRKCFRPGYPPTLQKPHEDQDENEDNLEKKLREIKGSGLNIGGGFNLKKSNISERSMSLNEKTVIKNNIKLLTIEQKKGIADILRDTIDTENKKIFQK